MLSDGIQRRLAAILVADIVGYSRLMESDEEYTHTSQMRLRSGTLEPGVTVHGGHIRKTTGDGFIALFDRVRNAIECALELQRAVAAQTAHEPAPRRISFRMAVHVADVIVEPDDVYGDGVNVAARLQAYAESGGLVVSDAAAEQMGNFPGVQVIDQGDLHLRNIGHSVRVLEIRPISAPARLVGDAPTDSEPRPSIAVLPFRMHQTGPDEGYFVDGIVEEIVHALAALKELFVVSRQSGLNYGGSTIDVRAIGHQLGVRYVLYGSVRRSGERLRIWTELSDAETGTVIHSDQHEGSLADLFELQGRITASVVKTIAPHVRERELVRAMRKPPLSLTAYDYVLQALDLIYRMDYESFSRARGLLQQAIVHDPGYAPAYAYTALWYVFRVGEIGSPDPDADAAAAAHYATAALERDGDDALSLAIGGHVHSYLLRDYARAISMLDRAVAAGPSSAIAWSNSSATRGYAGDGATAIAHAEQGVRLSPLDARLFWHEGILGQAHYVAGNYDDALDWVQSALARNESIRFSLRLLVVTLAALGRMEEAAEAGRQLLRVQPDFRLGPYSPRCPFMPPILDRWLERLRSAGIPE